MSHQDWTPVTIGKKKKPTVSSSDQVVLKSGHNNKQNKPTTSATKIEQKFDDDTFALPKVSHNLQVQLQQARQTKNWTQKQLAQASNITESIVKSYESGKAVPSQQDISKMSKALGVQLKNK